jgi:hypothetical protein
MKIAFKIIGTILILLAIAFYFIIGISIASSSHNISMVDRENAIIKSKTVLIIGIILIIAVWLPWKKILKIYIK